ncbi:MAG TPA: hypothetical protein VGJ37_01110 [Pyrinomonadaceae bacterium]|jgi:hypothetical protein
MKRVLGIAFALLTLGFVVPAEAKTAEISHESATVAASSAPQWQRDRYGRDRYDRYDRRRARTVTRSRVVRYGRRLYRETYVVRYYPNGRVDTQLISRMRIS